MKYHILVIVQKINDGEYMARAEQVRATAVGETPDEAVDNLREAIDEMVEEYGNDVVFKDVDQSIDYRMVELNH